MSGPETDATVLLLLRGLGPCPICKAEVMPPCEHRKRARWCVDGTDGPECGDCGAVVDIRQEHTCSSAHDHTDAYAEGERIGERKGRDLEARAIITWARHEATGRKVSEARANALRDFANAIERRDHDR